MFFLRNRLPHRYNPLKEIGPGHPVYERVAREYASDQRARANDPATVAAIRKGIDAKVAQWRAELEAKWEAEKKFIMDRDLPNSLTKPR